MALGAATASPESDAIVKRVVHVTSDESGDVN